MRVFVICALRPARNFPQAYNAFSKHAPPFVFPCRRHPSYHLAIR